jgi:hypothetical protein
LSLVHDHQTSLAMSCHPSPLVRPRWPAPSVSTGLDTGPLLVMEALVARALHEHRTWGPPHGQRGPKGNWGRHVAHPDTDGSLEPWDMVTAPESLGETQMAYTLREHRAWHPGPSFFRRPRRPALSMSTGLGVHECLRPKPYPRGTAPESAPPRDPDGLHPP